MYHVPAQLVDYRNELSFFDSIDSQIRPHSFESQFELPRYSLIAIFNLVRRPKISKWKIPNRMREEINQWEVRIKEKNE